MALQQSDQAVAATVDHAVTLGSVVRLELSRLDTGDAIEVELPRDRFEGLRLAAGRTVYLAPRRARFFLDSPTATQASA